METGVSTACLYPLETEKALNLLLEAGFRSFELFLNSESELKDNYLSAIRKRLLEYNARAYSFHLYTSGFEPFMFFSDYPRRFSDSLELYRRYFAAAAQTGARVAVFHGDHRGSSLPIEEYCARFYQLTEAAAAQGVTLAQENVSRCRSALSQDIKQMRAILGPGIKFVLDLKQAIRAGESPFDMLGAMGSGIVNVHISDSDDGRDCLLPGEGLIDFTRFKGLLMQCGYSGPMIIEVYRSNFKDLGDLENARKFTEALIGEV